MSLLIILILLPTIHLSWQEQTNTVEPRYNKGKGLAKFVCYIKVWLNQGSFSYIFLLLG